METYSDRSVKGEIVVLVDRGEIVVPEEQDIETDLRKALETLSVKDAATQVALDLGLKRRQVYQLALQLERDDDGPNELPRGSGG